MIDVPRELMSFLQTEEARSRNDDLLRNAETALKSYNGELYGDEEEGRSQVVSRDVAEVVDQMQISVLRTFVSGDRIAEFEPPSPDAEQAADDATESIQRDFTRNGYRLLHDWFKEGNLSTIGVVKACAVRKRQRVDGIYHQLMVPDHAIEAEETEERDIDGSPLIRAVTLEERPPEFHDYLVPLEEFRISPEARDVDEAVYVAHATPKTLSELTEMGFDDVDDLQGDWSADDLSPSRSATAFARDNGRSQFPSDYSGALRRVTLLEEYVRYDLDGDGIAERLCVHRVGSTVLRIEPTDYQPFVAYCPFPMPGRFAGHGLSDKVTDIQRISTVVLRGFLDGQYCNLAPGYIVPDPAVNESTYDDLLNVRPNRIIRTTGKAEITPEIRNDTSQSTLAALEFMIGQREARTGITRLNQGLDADSLNKTATGTALMQAQGQQMEEYLARNFAEAVAKLMRLKYRMKKEYAHPFSIRVDGEFRQVDPRQWPDEMDIVIRVGLGSGRKDQRLQNRMMLLQIQRECMVGGLPIVGPEQIYKSISGVVKDASLGSPADFVIDPETLKDPNTGEMPPQPPSPEEQKAQAELQQQQQKHEAEVQLKAADLQGKQAEAAAKLQLMQEESAAKLRLEAQKAEFEREQAIAQMQFERELAMARLEHEKQLAIYKADKDAEAKKYREGGSLAE